MTIALPDSAPSFDQPIAVLKHCHDRIRKQLATLDKLLPHLTAHGADEQAQQNRIAFGRTKAERQLTKAERDKAARTLDGHRLASPDDEPTP